MALLRDRLDEIERSQHAMMEQLHRIEDQICRIWDLLGRAAFQPPVTDSATDRPTEADCPP